MLGLLLRLPLSVKCGLAAALLCAVTGLTLLISSVTASRQILVETTDLIGKQWVVQLASQSQQALLRNDQISLQAILQDYASSRLVKHIRIDDAEGESLAETGSPNEEALRYQADIAADIGTLGQVSLDLDGSRITQEISDLGSTLLLLSAILCALAYSLIAVPINKLEDLLQLARARLSQPLRDDRSPYTGEDSLGDLLQEIHQPQIHLLPEQSQQQRRYVILHCQWQQLAKLRKQMTNEMLEEQIKAAIARAETIARLYQGELFFNYHNGLSLRFYERRDADAPLFRALCCAELFTKLDSLLKARCAIAPANFLAEPWRGKLIEAEIVENLHRTTNSGNGIWLEESLLEHEALSNWVDREGQEVTQMSPPYDELLARQLIQLQQLQSQDQD
ncbi:hypothetical protein IB286_03485 [Spongiibacter sp. KMU-158]|uniref:HAMP domain-containing protein n=1 Tax=Spongiibacter pelagi TaxID=2760804 RepID=A0A927C1B2_9GAMM|nr:hypothetical protein [Spongiibacter pelagi]MBD2858057.1 hypothetical protein [Spongiibacter pelagi]